MTNLSEFSNNYLLTERSIFSQEASIFILDLRINIVSHMILITSNINQPFEATVLENLGVPTQYDSKVFYSKLFSAIRLVIFKILVFSLGIQYPSKNPSTTMP